MKTYLYIICLNLICALGMAQVSQTDQNCYEIDFVFTGQVNNDADSIFDLQYTFTKKYFTNLRTITMEDSHKRRTLELKSFKSDSIALQTRGEKIILRINKYNKYDLPILLQAEDLSGKKHDLYLRKKSGRLQSATELKEQQRAARQMLNQDKF